MTQRRPESQTLRRWLRELRELCPPMFPVRVERRRIRDCLGYTILCRDTDGRPSHFRVVLETRMSHDALWLILIHEWAHCLAWHEGHATVCDHDPEWALAYSRVYQEFIGP